MYTVTLTQKGQIVIPAKIRRRLRLKKGTKLHVDDDGVIITIRPETPEYIKSLRGMYKGGEHTTGGLVAEHRAEMLKEDKKWKR